MTASESVYFHFARCIHPDDRLPRHWHSIPPLVSGVGTNCYLICGKHCCSLMLKLFIVIFVYEIVSRILEIFTKSFKRNNRNIALTQIFKSLPTCMCAHAYIVHTLTSLCRFNMVSFTQLFIACRNFQGLGDSEFPGEVRERHKCKPERQRASKGKGEKTEKETKHDRGRGVIVRCLSAVNHGRKPDGLLWSDLQSEKWNRNEELMLPAASKCTLNLSNEVIGLEQTSNRCEVSPGQMSHR